MDIQLDQIQNMIYMIRGQKVMLDSDLAKLYEVETKVLNQAVKRNSKRFPEDFMFECNSDELQALRSQFVTSKNGSNWNHMRRKPPMLFTENGVAMLSGILNSDRAIEVNISIMRIFTRLRSFHALEERVDRKVNTIEQDVIKVFKVVFERLDTLENIPKTDKKRKKIGLNNKV